MCRIIIHIANGLAVSIFTSSHTYYNVSTYRICYTYYTLGQVEGPITSVRSMSVPWYDNALPHTNSDANDGPPHSTEMTSRKDTIMPLVYRPVYLLHPNTPPSPPHREKEKGEKDDSANDINGDSTGRAEIISIDPVFADNEYSLGTHALLSTPQTTGEPVSTTGPAFYSLSVPTPPSVNPLSPPSLDDEL